MPKYPDVTVKLTDEDGNAYSILGRVLNKMRKAKIPTEDVNKFLKEANNGDYDHLLRTVSNWVTTV